MHHHRCVSIFLLFLNLLSLCLSTSTIYTVTPDDSNTTCHHCHNLQHYLLNITKYFTSNTQLLFLPGLHHLHIDLIIQNVRNISLIGSTAIGTALDTVIIQCNSRSSVGITMSNIVNLTITKLVIQKCHVKDNFLNLITLIFTGKSVILSQCYNVKVLHTAVFGLSQLHTHTILVVNVLGNSSFINLTSNGLVIEYNEVNTDDIQHKILIENYSVPSIRAAYFDSVIIVHFYQHSYKVKLEINNTKFTALSITRLFKVIRTVGNLIYFNKCIVEKFRSEIPDDVFYFELAERQQEKYYQVKFTDCRFRFNSLTRSILFNIRGQLNMKLQSCIFKYSQFQVIKVTNSTIIITNTSFYSITCYFLIQIINTSLYLEGPVLFTQIRPHQYSFINSAAIIFVDDKHSNISYHKYIEFSEIEMTNTVFHDHARYVIVKENTLINMTNNLRGGKAFRDEWHESNTKLTGPCYYQYNLQGKNLDSKMTKLNCTILFHNDIFIYSLLITHCRWLPGSAFNSTKPIDVNKKVITGDFHFEIVKYICYCSSNNTQDCYVDTLATAYPGQTISLSLTLNKQYLYSITENSSTIVVKTNDKIIPPTACKPAKVTEIIQTIRSHCTVINFTVIHNGLSYLQWCEIFLEIPPDQIDAYYINILPCPTGFVQKNGICICDPILTTKPLSVITCDINYQTILRPAGSWLSAMTINDPHQYHISTHCPLHYCLPQSSQLNFSTPNTQCQFNRSGLLCGCCQQGLSTVFGYYHCQHCSNVYLLLIIPIAVAGLVLVLLLFILNLTVTDGDINGFILYVNIISINNHVFFPQYSNSINIFYAFISLANLDLGIPMCFYNGMDDYAKMWLQLAFPAYLILIATLLIIASRHSTKVQRITARRALPVLATLFLLSYTKILRTVSSVLFYYSTITHLPSGHTTLMWAVDANIPLFGLKYTPLFIVCLILFLILLPFNAILTFTKTSSNFAFINHFKPLIDAYQGPYKYKYYYWTGLQLVMRAVFFGLSALDKNVNLTVSIILLAVISITQANINPLKHNYKNFYELCYLFYLSTMYTLSYGQYSIAVNIINTIAALQFLLIIIHHTISNICGGVTLYKFKSITEMIVKWFTR